MIISSFDKRMLHKSNNIPIKTTLLAGDDENGVDPLIKLDKIWDSFTPKSEEQKKIISDFSIPIDAFAMKVVHAHDARINTAEFLQAKRDEFDGLKLRDVWQVVKKG